MNILSFLWEWRFLIIIGVAFLLYCVLEWQKAKAVLYRGMLQAKKLAKDAVLNSGQEQEEWVIEKAYQFLPLSWRIFISKDRVRIVVRWLYKKAKDYLDDGILNNSNT